MSAEPARKKPYSEDLRWRIVYQRLGMGFTFCKIARNLNIATSTVHRIYKSFESTGHVEPAKRKSWSDLRALDERTELIVVGLILSEPSLYLNEITQKIQDLTTVTVSPSTICRLFKRYGFTRKKIRQIAKQRCYALRGAFMAHCTLFSRDMFVWVDETGSDARAHIRKYGYALRGITPSCHRILARGKRLNAIAALSSSGIVAHTIVQTTVSGKEYFDFLRSILIPNMMPYNGTNPKSILIMDNCSVHHTSEVKDLLNSCGLLYFYLPPYSPDLNPIEEAFSFMKSYLRKHDSLLQSGAPLAYLVNAGFDDITVDQCNAWITDSGYQL